MLFPVRPRAILVIAALAKAIQAQGTFSGIPDTIPVGSDLNVVFSYSGSSEVHALTLGIVPAGGLAQRRIIRNSPFTSTSRKDWTLTVPVVAGTYCVQALYSDSNGDLHRDRSSPFIAFDSDPITMMPPSMATPGSMASESSTQSTSEAPTTVIEQTTSGSSTSITADSDSIPSGVKTSAGSITTDIDSTPNGTKIGISSITSTGTTSTNVGQPTTFASSTDTRQPATSPSITSPAPSNAVSSGNDRSNSKAAIIAGSVIGGTLVLLAIIIPVRRRYKRIQGDSLLVQPYTLWCPIEKRPRKGIEESGQEEDEVGTTEARVEPAPHTGADRARQSIVVVHEDSGWRPDRALTPGNVRVVDLPPDYDAAQ